MPSCGMEYGRRPGIRFFYILWKGLSRPDSASELIAAIRGGLDTRCRSIPHTWGAMPMAPVSARCVRWLKRSTPSLCGVVHGKKVGNVVHIGCDRIAHGVHVRWEGNPAWRIEIDDNQGLFIYRSRKTEVIAQGYRDRGTEGSSLRPQGIHGANHALGPTP